MRRLEYWLTKTSESRPWITYDLIPMQTIPDSFYFDEFVEYVRSQGWSYRVIETSEKLLASENDFGKPLPQSVSRIKEAEK